MTLATKKSVIVLVGRSGVGKSTLGPALAEALNYGFFDIDLELSDLRVGKCCQVSARRGIFHGLTRCNNVVIAAGFEDFSDEIMAERIKDQVFSVWITANSAGRLGLTRYLRTSFYSISTSEQDKLFGFADLTVSLGALPIPEAGLLLVESVTAALSRQE